MLNLFRKPAGLRLHVLVITVSMVLLINLLGFRVYSIARRHFAEISALADQDVKSQALLIKMEGVVASRDHAVRKLSITGDPAYEGLVAHEEVALARLKENLEDLFRGTYPEMAERVSKVDNVSEIRALKMELDEKKRDRLLAADHGAVGILRLILIALILSICIASWLFFFLFSGLLRPLSTLKEATARIRSGELSFRVPLGKRGVAELKELSESFNSMAERLELLEQSKTEFLATVSHEFKNPLAALKEGLALLASRWGDLSPEARERTFAACLIASKRLESMMNNLLHHARMESGFFEFDLALKNLATAIETSINEVGPVAGKKGMSIDFQGPKELKAAFNWDGMVHVLENLLLNAIKYGNEKSPIEVRAFQTQKSFNSTAGVAIPCVEITIANQGKTIGAVDLSRIFECFYRGSNSSRQQGLGLGLHVVKRIVEAHHGEVSVSSKEGKTEFRVLIPGRYENISWAGGHA